MAFGRSKGRDGGKSSNAAPPPPRPDTFVLSERLQQGVALQSQTVAQLEAGLHDGQSFYNDYNEARLKLAFDNFDPEMSQALFELIYLLHVNTPELAKLRYTTKRKDPARPLRKEVEVQAEADLYVDGAPHGVVGIESVSSVFRGDFSKFIQRTFGRAITPGTSQRCAVVCLQSIGSIGTVGHKSGASDLDLQVVYDPFPLGFDAAKWSDVSFRVALKAEHMWWMKRLRARYKLTAPQLKKPEVMKKLSAQASVKVAAAYPLLYPLLAQTVGDITADHVAKLNPAKLTHELTTIIKRYAKINGMEETTRQEALLKTRVDRIQAYIADKYPTAEIYMFLVSLDKYRAGQYTSSLQFKESSGSAYELILNYETLMPGIHFSPTIPSHFLFPPFVNDNAGMYQRIQDYADFKLTDVYDGVSRLMVDLGATPQLDEAYVAKHWGAAYWEAFKAASGNLPKATLNLLRYEMLLHPHLLKTNIQIIKDPQFLNRLITARQDAPEATSGEPPLPTWALLEMENFFPALLEDPWWLRYKSLKVGFAEPAGVPGPTDEERERVSRVLDLAFALHLRITDVFTKPGDKRTFETYREQVLVQLLELAFPPDSARRKVLEFIHSGEVAAVNRFENELRGIFSASLVRIQVRIKELGMEDAHKKNDEVKLWRHYYEQHFEPKPNMVQRSIMYHLKFPRGRVRIGHRKGKGWYFLSMQRESGVGRRFDTFGVLNIMPDEVTLVENTGFLHGLTNCIINDYYGIVNRGTLKERRTALEFDARHLDVGNDADNRLCFVRPDQIERIMDRILTFFPPEQGHYTDVLTQDRAVKRIFIFLNLWRYGRVSILYRDNLNTWFCDEFDNADITEAADALSKEPDQLLNHASLHESLERFLIDKRLYFDQVELETWVNPHSVETSHGNAGGEQKEQDLSAAFLEAIRRAQRSQDTALKYQ